MVVGGRWCGGAVAVAVVAVAVVVVTVVAVLDGAFGGSNITCAMSKSCRARSAAPSPYILINFNKY